jgi:3-dehydroquinate synthase
MTQNNSRRKAQTGMRHGMSSVALNALKTLEVAGENRAYIQRFSVSYEFIGYFSGDVFSLGNSVLRDAISRVPGSTPCKVSFFLDDGVARQMPDLEMRRLER